MESVQIPPSLQWLGTWGEGGSWGIYNSNFKALLLVERCAQATATVAPGLLRPYASELRVIVLLVRWCRDDTRR